MTAPCSSFAGPDSPSVDRELATGPAAGGDVRLPDPTPILEAAKRLAQGVLDFGVSA